MLEHLSRSAVSSFLFECNRVLMPGGILRLAVPDLQMLVENYLRELSADDFMASLYVTSPPLEGIQNKLRLLISGYRHHQWMYDANSLSAVLRAAGFNSIFRMFGGESNIACSDNLDLFERAEHSLYVEAIK